MRHSLRVESVLVALWLLGANAAMGAGPQQTLAPVAEGPAAPDLVLEAATGGKVGLADLRGKVVLVNFWATWCPPCRREMPTLDRLHERMQGQAFAIVGINAGEQLEDVLGYRMPSGASPRFPLLLDREGKALKAFGVKGLPTTFILDRKGRIAYKALGARDFEDPSILAVIHALIVAR